MSTFFQLFGAELPIVQAPMAGVQGSDLAAAVSNAGGIGSLPCAMLSLATMRSELAAIRAKTAKPFNVNFFCHTPPQRDDAREARWREALSPYYKELGIDAGAIPPGAERAPFNSDAAELLEKLKPRVISFHFGLPSAGLMARVRSLGSVILASATTVKEAKWLESHGVDAVIAQGSEAGGHRGMFLSEDLTTQLGTFDLLPQIVKAVTIPVIAAGGIADARGVSGALSLGAIAAQIGTTYLTCPEATTGPVHRTALRSQDSRHTALTNVFTGRPARGIMNRLMRELGPMSDLAPDFPAAATAVAPLRAKAESLGDCGFSPLWCGQNASGCAEKPAAELTRLLAGV